MMVVLKAHPCVSMNIHGRHVSSAEPWPTGQLCWEGGGQCGGQGPCSGGHWCVRGGCHCVVALVLLGAAGVDAPAIVAVEEDELSLWEARSASGIPFGCASGLYFREG